MQEKKKRDRENKKEWKKGDENEAGSRKRPRKWHCEGRGKEREGGLQKKRIEIDGRRMKKKERMTKHGKSGSLFLPKPRHKLHKTFINSSRIGMPSRANIIDCSTDILSR